MLHTPFNNYCTIVLRIAKIFWFQQLYRKYFHWVKCTRLKSQRSRWCNIPTPDSFLQMFIDYVYYILSEITYCFVMGYWLILVIPGTCFCLFQHVVSEICQPTRVTISSSSHINNIIWNVIPLMLLLLLIPYEFLRQHKWPLSHIYQYVLRLIIFLFL